MRKKTISFNIFTRNWLYEKISILTSFAFVRISKSFSLDNFFVSIIRFNVDNCLINLSIIRTFSGLSINIVFNEAKNFFYYLNILYKFIFNILWLIIWIIASSPSVS